MSKIILIRTMKIAVIILLFIQRAHGKGTYEFYRDINNKTFAGTRRIYGGEMANVEEFPGTCALADYKVRLKCTGTIVTKYFVVTAAHCIMPYLQYVLYNTRNPKEKNDKTKISHIYQHPRFNYKIEDDGLGPDVVWLQHDVGLVQSKEPMFLTTPARRFDLHAIWSASLNVMNRDVKILGFGRTSNPSSSELLKLTLRTVECARPSWLYCACGIPKLGQSPGGVCNGDSGGPVVFNNTLVGVTSMGPAQCSAASDLDVGAASVFTLLSGYVDIINDTINQSVGTEHMTEKQLLNQADSGQGGHGHSMTRNTIKMLCLWLIHFLLVIHF